MLQIITVKLRIKTPELGEELQQTRPRGRGRPPKMAVGVTTAE